MTRSSELRFRYFDGEQARAQRDLVELIYCDAYADLIAGGGPFESAEASMARFDSYTKAPGFVLIIGYLDATPVGQTWGWPLQPNTGWWRGLVAEPEPGFTAETGFRTFALSELMVRLAWRGHGYARALHDEILGSRTEGRATLLAIPGNDTANGAYQRWGWRRVADLRPDMPHAPLLHVLIRD